MFGGFKGEAPKGMPPLRPEDIDVVKAREIARKEKEEKARIEALKIKEAKEIKAKGERYFKGLASEKAIKQTEKVMEEALRADEARRINEKNLEKTEKFNDPVKELDEILYKETQAERDKKHEDVVQEVNEVLEKMKGEMK